VRLRHRPGLAVGYGLEAVLAPVPVERTDLVAAQDLDGLLCAVLVDDHVRRGLLAQAALATPDGGLRVIGRQLAQIGGVLEHEPCGV